MTFQDQIKEGIPAVLPEPKQILIMRQKEKKFYRTMKKN